MGPSPSTRISPPGREGVEGRQPATRKVSVLECLRLEPRAGAPATSIEGSHSFADGAFGADVGGGLVHGAAVGGHEGGAGRTAAVLSKLEPVEDGTPLAPWSVPDVLALVAEDVEDVQGDGLGGGAVADSAVEAGGEQLEVGPAVRGGDDHLAVEYEVAEPGEALEFGQFGRPVVPAPRPQTDSSVADLCSESPPV